ncbi:hypothetical protein GOBAR_AA30944 [Gossypium barbadense]|uniref:Uncharacterized protein n=1 Tax=Gossypium barbadense TaxID=3634 RepID=A0A2P5WFB3_GOSBA|nr:hypothetical protein GOBAR_AA30944 [Gossypium barbadense]
MSKIGTSHSSFERLFRRMLYTRKVKHVKATRPEKHNFLEDVCAQREAPLRERMRRTYSKLTTYTRGELRAVRRQEIKTEVILTILYPRVEAIDSRVRNVTYLSRRGPCSFLKTSGASHRHVLTRVYRIAFLLPSKRARQNIYRGEYHTGVIENIKKQPGEVVGDAVETRARIPLCQY